MQALAVRFLADWHKRTVTWWFTVEISVDVCSSLSKIERSSNTTTQPSEVVIVTKINTEYRNTAIEFPSEYGPASTAVQAVWRGFLARRRYEESRTARQWATVKVQSLFRSRKAMSVFAKHMRCVLDELGRL